MRQRVRDKSNRCSPICVNCQSGPIFRAESTEQICGHFFGSREYEANRPMDLIPLVGIHTHTPKISFKGLRTFVSRSVIRGEILCPGPVSVLKLTVVRPR